MDDIFKTLFGDLATQDLNRILQQTKISSEGSSEVSRAVPAKQDRLLALESLQGQAQAKKQVIEHLKAIRGKQIQSFAVVITGPSGSGKSTLVEILEGSLARSRLPSVKHRFPHLALKSSEALSRSIDELFLNPKYGTLIFEDCLIEEHRSILKQILIHVEHQAKLGASAKSVLITMDRSQGLGPTERAILQKYFLSEVELKPLDQASMFDYALQLLKDFTLQEPAQKQLSLRLEHAKRQESFANYLTIQRIVEQIIDQQRARTSNQTTGVEAAQTIIYSDVTEDPQDLSESENPKAIDSLQLKLGELESLTGLTQLKRHLRRLIAFIRVSQTRQQPIHSQSLHMVFAGNPGTGKTTVARLLAGMFCELKLLSSGHLIETERSELVAGFVGQTAIKTKEKLQAAQGGVLFIDEAYTLHRGTSEDAYGQEAIDTILKGMEDQRGQFVLVIAGYTQEMAVFMESNPGLQSRFPLHFDFPDFTPAELREIAVSQAQKQGFRYEGEALDKFLTILEKARAKPNFGNARTVRNILEQSIRNHAERIVNLGDPSGLDEAILNTLSIADLDEGSI